MTRYLLISLGVLALFHNCRSPYPIAKKDFVPARDSVYNSSFADYNQEYIYRAKLSIYGKELGGLFIVKRLNAQSHRLVLTSDFGNTLFDVTLDAQTYQLNYALEDLNKKVIIQMLVQDFRTLLQVSHQSHFKTQLAGQTVYWVQQQSNKLFFYRDNFNNNLNKVVFSSRYQTKFNIIFHYTPENELESIQITHQNIPLRMDLKTI